MASTTPMQRTLKVLKEQDMPYWKVEHWNPFTKQRQDMFHIIDVIALDRTKIVEGVKVYGKGIIGIQVCGTDFASHWRKIIEEHRKEAFDWLSTPGAILEIWSWRKLKKVRGKKATYWTPRIVQITLSDLDEI